MSRAIPLYLLTAALLAASVYLHSAAVAMSVVALWAVRASEDIFTRKNKDADIVEIQTLMDAHKTRMAALERDVVNVAERARTILGENF